MQEYARRVQSEMYQNDPERWLQDRFGQKSTLYKWSDYPGYENHVWDGTPDPFFQAIKSISQGRNVGIEAATSTGKTHFMPYIIYWFLDVFPNSLVITTAPKKDQLRKVLWSEMARAYPRFKRIRPFSEFLTLNVKADSRTIKAINSNDGGNTEGNVGHEALGFVAGVGAGEESATKFQGFHRENMLFVIDEMAGIHHAVITAIINTSTAENNRIVGIGNPDSQVDSLHRFCQLESVDHIRISGLDFPNVVLNREFIKGAVSVKSVLEREEMYGKDSWLYNSRVRGIAPTEGVDSLIKADWIDSCNVNDEKKFHGKERNETMSSNAVGIDVANSQNGDAAAAAYGRGNELNYLREFQCPNATHLAYNFIWPDHKIDQKKFTNYKLPKLYEYDIEDHNVGVDGVGVGTATVNAFRDEEVNCISLVGGELEYAILYDKEGKALFSFNNLRSQMYFEFREDVRSGHVNIDLPKKVFDALKKELITIKYEVRSGKVCVESKIEIKKRLGKSPNLADAVVYWNWIRKDYYRPKKIHLPFSKGS